MTQIQRPDRGARVKTPARVRARGCVVVWTWSPGRFCLGPVRGGCDGDLTRRRVNWPHAAANDGDSVRISRTNTPWFAINRFVINCWRQRKARPGALRLRDPRAPRDAPGWHGGNAPCSDRRDARPGGGPNPRRSHRTSTRTQIGPAHRVRSGFDADPSRREGLWHDDRAGKVTALQALTS